MPTSLNEYRLRRKQEPVDREQCLSLYRTLSSSVSIVSAMCPELGPLGLTVSAIGAISADPPLLAVCLAHESRTLNTAVIAGRFGVHVLRADQRALATEFATPNSARFTQHGFASIMGVPILTEVDTWAISELVDARIYGDRTLLIGEVIATRQGSSGDPLIWHDSSYLDIDPSPPISGREQ
ncbi:putative flavin-dependent reductase [Mycobacteroides stephanolepidis]|uniref:Putative flavin-dependent reductase n=1 Tax=[Mycobacterium] stephanolepidis TaxID=1520670 RepID=A0A1Z4EXW6_9MYCO|nr:flavin reductase family protein [[Mycobacterium] stephanolepidis]BAX97805.1 putative flavin-dependent reductase [[Mycobacterium] stephanolepidis]